MKNILKLEYKKFVYSYTLWVILIVLILSSCISVFSNIYDNISLLSKTLYSDSMVLLIAGAIYAGLSTTSDFNNGFIRHYLIVFNKRENIILAKFIHFIIGCIILLLLHPMITLLISIFYQGVGEPMTLMKNLILDMLSVLPYYCSMFSIFFMIAILSKKDGVTLGIAIPLSIILVIFTGRLIPNIDILKYSPVIQIQEVLKNGIDGSPFFISVTVSIILIILTISISVIKFKHDEF